jgi:uncharacterized membrane protein
MRKRWLGLVLTAIAAAVSLWAYPRLPETVPTHWNIHGQPDGYSSRLFGAVIMPVVMLGLTGLFQVLPRIDPKGANYAKFPDTYWLLVNGVLAFILVLHVATLNIALGSNLNLNRVILVGGGGLFALLGNYLGRIESNWFLGIRTPWTLSSETVWRKTHRTAAWLFVAGGMVAVAIGVIQPVGQLKVLAVIAAIVAGIPIVQSYVLWRRERAQ